MSTRSRSSGRATEVGTICHSVLEHLDFRKPAVPEATNPEAAEAAEILKKFFKSAPFKELAGAEILARELPFLIPRGEQAMEGVIDVIYRLDGKMWIADYKTDRVTGSEAPAQAGVYAAQAAIYREAAARCLGLSRVSFQLLFLRAGVAIDL